MQNKAATVSLAVGDGTNDSNMMAAASLGVAVGSREDSLICNADIRLSSFQCLQALLLETGRETYRKNCRVFFHVVYYNLLFQLPRLLIISISGDTYGLHWHTSLYLLPLFYFVWSGCLVYSGFFRVRHLQSIFYLFSRYTIEVYS